MCARMCTYGLRACVYVRVCVCVHMCEREGTRGEQKLHATNHSTRSDRSDLTWTRSNWRDRGGVKCPPVIGRVVSRSHSAVADLRSAFSRNPSFAPFPTCTLFAFAKKRSEPALLPAVGSPFFPLSVLFFFFFLS